jgi:putative restriction endonuclease
MLERHLQKLDELASAADISGHSPVPDALGDTDARKRIIKEVVARQGQARFRDALIRAHDGRWAVTGCDSSYALEAAHIRSYLGEHTNVVTNGLLLRADIHVLFDLGLLAVNPATCTVMTSDRLSGKHYKSLHGRLLNLPANPALHPSPALLTERWTWFEGKQAGFLTTS